MLGPTLDTTWHWSKLFSATLAESLASNRPRELAELRANVSEKHSSNISVFDYAVGKAEGVGRAAQRSQQRGVSVGEVFHFQSSPVGFCRPGSM